MQSTLNWLAPVARLYLAALGLGLLLTWAFGAERWALATLFFSMPSFAILAGPYFSARLPPSIWRAFARTLTAVMGLALSAFSAWSHFRPDPIYDFYHPHPRAPDPYGVAMFLIGLYLLLVAATGRLQVLNLRRWPGPGGGV